MIKQYWSFCTRRNVLFRPDGA